MIHKPMSTDGVHPQISSSLRLLVLCLVRPDLFVIYYRLFIFFKEPIFFIGSLDKCYTSVFNALILTATKILADLTIIGHHLSKHFHTRSITCNLFDLTLSQTTNFRLFQTERICRQQFET